MGVQKMCERRGYGMQTVRTPCFSGSFTEVQILTEGMCGCRGCGVQTVRTPCSSGSFTEVQILPEGVWGCREGETPCCSGGAGVCPLHRFPADPQGM